MGQGKNMVIASGLALSLSAAGCGQFGQLSKPPEERDRAAAVGGLGGGATGAIIGSMTGSALAGGLVGLPLGAVAGYYVGDQLQGRDDNMRSIIDEQEREIDRLRRENERFRNDDRPITRSQAPQNRSMAQSSVHSRDVTSTQAQEQQKQLTPIMREMSNAEVREVQRSLNDMGFHAGSVDGIWGPNTRAAIRNFQQAKGINVTGTLNEKTANALDVASSDGSAGMQRAAHKTMSNAEMRQLQQRLNDLGFQAGHVDGVWGPKTQAAIRNFQQARDIDVTGMLDEKTLGALKIQKRDEKAAGAGSMENRSEKTAGGMNMGTREEKNRGAANIEKTEGAGETNPQQ